MSALDAALDQLADEKLGLLRRLIHVSEEYDRLAEAKRVESLTPAARRAQFRVISGERNAT